MPKCRSCDTPIEAFMSFGQQPLANALLSPTNLHENQPTYELAPAMCSACGLFQLLEQPTATSMFTEQYPFFTSSSKFMSNHFKALAQDLLKTHHTLNEKGFIIDIGSNDGTLLKTFAKTAVNHLGVEPSKSVAEMAKRNGINTDVSFFNSETASLIRKKYGPADIILGTNVIAHIATINDIALGVASLLKENGVFIIEAVYLGDVILNTAFDQLYDEHVFTFSATAVANVFRKHGLELVNVEPQTVHGGSMRYTLAPSGSREPSGAVDILLNEEARIGLTKPGTYVLFRERCETIRRDLPLLVREIAALGRKIVGYGATAKSVTVLNYCGLGRNDISWIQDSTKTKQGMLSPKTLIPIVSPEYFREVAPDYAILFAWNHKDEIEIREQKWRKDGGKWVFYLPEVTIQ